MNTTENTIIISDSDEEVEDTSSTLLRRALTKRVSSQNKIVTDADENVDGTRSPLLRTALTQKASSQRRLTRIKSPIKRLSCSNVNQLHQEDGSMICSSKKIRVIDSEEEGTGSFLLKTALTQRVSSQKPPHVKSPIKEPPCSSDNQPVDKENRSMICSICLNYWTNLGEHRICCLKCGHAFGFSCISKWINILKKNNCPICKAEATAREIRNIYVNELVAIDSNQNEEQKLELTAEKKINLQDDLTKSACRESFFENQIRELQSKVNFLNSALEEKSMYATDGVKMYREKSVELRKEGGCRVLSYYKNGNLIVASTKSSNSLLSGFGARKIDLATLQPTSYIPLHSDMIRDMKFHSAKSWLITASLDKTFKIIDTNSSTVTAVQNNNNLPLWSCCWDTNDTNSFFVGEQGLVVKYDVRRMSQSTYTYVVPGDLSSVVSIASITANSAGPFQDGGIIMCKMNSLWVFGNKVNGEECTHHLLPIDPPFICATYDNAKSKMLVSTRPTSKFRCTRHHVSYLARKDSDNIIVNISHCFEGSAISTYLSRSCFLTHRGSSYAAAYQEFNNMVCLWSVDTGQRVSIVPAYNPIFDLCSVNIDNFTYLCSLSDSTFDCFKCQ